MARVHGLEVGPTWYVVIVTLILLLLLLVVVNRKDSLLNIFSDQS
jgi:uncharacterized integral membrane protein